MTPTLGAILLGGLRPSLDLNYLTAATPDGLSVTSAPEVVTLSGSNFTRWFNPNGGTFVVEALQPILTGGAPTIFAVDLAADPFPNRILCFLSGTNAETRVTNTTEQATLNLGAVSANTPFRVALAYGTNSFASSKNGGTPATDGAGTLPSVNRLEIGGISGLNFFNGYIRRLRYYPRRLPDSTLQRLTA